MKKPELIANFQIAQFKFHTSNVIRFSTVLATQLLRSDTSVGANVEEAGSTENRKDIIHKYAIACKDLRESHCWLRLLAASGLVI